MSLLIRNLILLSSLPLIGGCALGVAWVYPADLPEKEKIYLAGEIGRCNFGSF